MIKKVMTVAAGAAIALLGASAAGASTGPTHYNNGKTEGAGYSASQAMFRYVQDSVYLRSPSKFAAADDGVSWETHLYGSNTVTGHAVKVVLGIGGDPQAQSTYGDWATVNGNAMTTGGDTTFSGGQTVTESIYYDRASGVVHVNAYDGNGDSFFGSAYVGGNVAFNNPRIIGGIDPGSSFAAPSAPVTLAHFTNVHLTTYSGYHGTIKGSYQHNRMVVTSDGTSTGTIMAAASSLNDSGSSFTVYIEPAS